MARGLRPEPCHGLSDGEGPFADYSPPLKLAVLKFTAVLFERRRCSDEMAMVSGSVDDEARPRKSKPGPSFNF